MQIDRQEQGGHNHRDGNGETVGSLHVGGLGKVDHYEGAGDPEQPVHERNVDLSLDGGWIEHLDPWPDIQRNGFADERIGSADQSLTGDNGGSGGDDDPGYQEPLGHNGVKDIHIFGIGQVVQQPGTLSEVVE